MKHVVVGIITNPKDKDQYLLINSKKDFGEFTGFFYPPGGHLEEDESEEIALTREIKEELNVNVIATKKLAETGSDVKDQITHWWECDYDGSEMKIDESEIGEAKWLTREEILKNDNIWPATKKFFENYL